ncbi:hypothetical protein GCM10022289_45270 [Pedobacter jeongneungensis]|uniref:Uncharacterized protein n=1 Tax=Pedobacter jeongneungensis TaxID=947309 RepID=A0ABP8BQ23_9SPHI
MDEMEKQGRNDILRSLASILLFSLYVSVTYHVSLGHVDQDKLVVHIIRFLLTVLIFYLIFQGYSWARNLFSVLTAIGLVILIPPVFEDAPIVNKIPLFVGLVVYSLALYRLNFSANAKAYFAYVKENR